MGRRVDVEGKVNLNRELRYIRAPQAIRMRTADAPLPPEEVKVISKMARSSSSGGKATIRETLLMMPPEIA